MEQNPSTRLNAQPTRSDCDSDKNLKKILKRIRRTKDFPSISTYLVEINNRLSDTTAHTSASDLANVILKDYALTNKLLKLVNSAFYGFVAGDACQSPVFKQGIEEIS